MMKQKIFKLGQFEQSDLSNNFCQNPEDESMKLNLWEQVSLLCGLFFQMHNYMYKTNNSQQQFIRQSIKNSVRPDGRSNNQYRHPFIRTNIINQANASASVSFEFNQISFYVTIKLQIEKTTTPSILLSIDTVKKREQEEKEDIFKVMENILFEHFISHISLQDFVIPKSKSSIKVFVDVVLLSYSHFNLFESISTGILSAFSTLEIPVLKSLINEVTGEEQIQVEEKHKKFGGYIPTLILVGQVQGQLVCDMTSEEYESMDSVTLLLLGEDDAIYGIHQLKGFIDPEAGLKMIRFAQNAKKVLKQL